MVNRGGRSKGCGTCRRRRVKCDEGRPHCQRCEKAGITCSGYAQHAQFVDETARFKRDELRSQSSSQSQSQSQSQSRDASPRRDEVQMQMEVQAASLAPAMSLRPDEDTVIHTHLVARLLPRVSGPASPDILVSMVNYESAVSSLSTTVPLHKDALRALAAVYFGKVHHDTRIYDTGVRAYVRSLRRLRTALTDPVAVFDVETLASVLCLCLYENVALTEITGWLVHYDGIAHLIERRGPARHQSGFGHELFWHCRFAIVISALVRRRHCFLTRPEWRAISRQAPAAISDSVTSPSVHTEENLMDLFARVPGILHDFGVAQTPDASPESVANLLSRVGDLLAFLSTWRQSFEPTGNTDMSLLALHHAVLLCLSPVCEAFELPLVVADMSREDPRRSLASDICRLAKDSFDRSPSSTGAFLFIFPLHVAARHLPPGTEEATWAETAMQRIIVETHGFEIGRPRTWKLEGGQVSGSEVTELQSPH
ncbi:hypothetical protein Sste5346_004983 [Sporothrix stenoceras]|uniref:Zn(2)-C6 fungal-type domain-containing protein n=1 Tax=Sporothrix stenoceras TaxID=5173 RepID=A0ABR3Z722_9PEZI